MPHTGDPQPRPTRAPSRKEEDRGEDKTDGKPQEELHAFLPSIPSEARRLTSPLQPPKMATVSASSQSFAARAILPLSLLGL